MDKLVCIGKNYHEHARELGEAMPEKPVLFLKPPSVLRIATGRRIELRIPRGRGALHHECEIVARVGADGQISAVTLGLDMTLRDLQGELKKKGHPWTVSKVFRDSAVIGPWIPLTDFPSYLDEEFRFEIDGQIRQRGRGRAMGMNPTACLDYIRESFPLCEGDLVFTGTPEGVGPVQAGQSGELIWGERLKFSVKWIEVEI